MINYKAFNLAAIVLVAASQSLAEPADTNARVDSEEPWCEDDSPWAESKEKFAPDGAITQVGPYFFRVCQGGSSTSTPGSRHMRFFYNPRRVPGLQHDRAMIGLMINDRSSWDETMSQSLRNHHFRESWYLSEARYDLYQFLNDDGTWGKAMTFLYVPDTNENDDVPPHILACNDGFKNHPAQSARCFILVDYNEIFALLLFMGGGPEFPEMPVDEFPEFAQDVIRILDTANVTATLDEVLRELPLLP